MRDLFHVKVNSNTFRESNSVQIVMPPSVKGSTLKGKNAAFGSKFFLHWSTSLFRQGIVCSKANRKSRKLSPLSKMAVHLPTVSIPLDYCRQTASSRPICILIIVFANQAAVLCWWTTKLLTWLYGRASYCPFNITLKDVFSFFFFLFGVLS